MYMHKTESLPFGHITVTGIVRMLFHSLVSFTFPGAVSMYQIKWVFVWRKTL